MTSFLCGRVPPPRGSMLSLVSTLTSPVSQLWSPRGVVCAGGEDAFPLTQPCTHHQLTAASVHHAQAGSHCLDSVLGGYDWLGLSLCLFYTCIFLELQDTKHGLGGVWRGTSYSGVQSQGFPGNPGA